MSRLPRTVLLLALMGLAALFAGSLLARDADDTPTAV